jgi:hypothetical protein
MRRRYTHHHDTGLGGEFVTAFTLTIVITLIAFFLANAGLFDPKPVARAGFPPRGDVVVFSNGEMAQVKSRPTAQPFALAQSPHSPKSVSPRL